MLVLHERSGPGSVSDFESASATAVSRIGPRNKTNQSARRHNGMMQVPMVSSRGIYEGSQICKIVYPHSESDVCMCLSFYSFLVLQFVFTMHIVGELLRGECHTSVSCV